MQAIEDANVAILVIDATAGAADQDSHIAGYVLEAGRSAVVAVNKCDALDAGDRARLKLEFERRFKFLDFARFHYISARTSQGLDACMRAVDEAYRAAFLKMSTPRLTRIVREAIEANPPARKGLTRPKLRFAHQGGSNPPIVVIHGTGVDNVAETYRRYLEHRVREMEERFPDDVPRPEFWGAYRLRPSRVEFWQGQPSRLHDRFVYERRTAGGWTISRLAP